MTAVPANAAEIIDGPKVNWNFAVWGKRRAFTEGMEYAAEQVKERTGGKFTITMGYGSFSKPKETLDGVKLGATQGAMFCNFYHPGKNPAFMVFTLPFLPLGDPDVRIRVTRKLYEHPALVADMDRWNAMTYVSTILPQYEFFGRGKEPHKPEDFAGMRVRAGGGIGSAMEKLGATLSTVPATEVYTTLERGTVDAASFPYTYAHVAYKLHEIADWFTGNLSPGTSECPAVFNKDAYAALPQQYKDLLMGMRDEIYAVQKKAYADIDAKNLPMLREKLTEITYTEEQRADFQEKAGKVVWDEWVKDNPKLPGQELIDLILSEAKASM
ncbi:hypothetical protein [Oceanibacterium hippocampi]|uniref:hypothetical protein n=1 Tax=Oceanibacterium hippocampi TaxID=745714 RepID=UPI001C391EFD|nr:hypothetical protein [Oceanibacterium hippocampi]